MDIQKHSVVQDEKLIDILQDIGYVINANIGKEALHSLQELYSKHHNVKEEKGGMFYSLYSLNLDYRKKINDEILKILSPFYNELFQHYKTVINSFIVKYNGEESAFSLHQDSTSLDENVYSPLSVWIPLQDTNIDNGCLCVVPQSHKIFYPYRGISFPTPFSNIENTLRKYLEPIEMKAGDILLFDNRLVHYSPANHSSKPRIVAMSGIFPQEAKLINCFQDNSLENAPLEIYEQDDDFLLKGKNFYHDCTARPTLGKKAKEISISQPIFTEEMFLNKAKELHLIEHNLKEMQAPKKMNIVSEPKNEKSIKSFLLNLIK